MKNRDEGMVKTYHRKKLLVSITCVILALLLISIRLLYVCVFQSSYYLEKAQKLHERERDIKALRGEILDRNGVVLASNKTVCTVSVIHSQITQPQEVIQMLVKELDITEEAARKRVEKVSSIERVKTNVDKETGDRIREYNYSGVKVDEDYKRYYPYSKLCSKVLGFTGSDNQGILGLEAKYDAYLSGTPGQILTLTDAWGVEVKNGNEERDEPEKGSNLYTSIDINIQSYAQQLAQKTLEQKQAKSVSIIVMNPENGEILAMTNEPEYDLNNPYELNSDLLISSTGTSKMDLLNNMWRNFCINDTYEPGSIFKMVTATAALETGSVTLNDHFTCGGSAIVADRKIRCHKTTGHGTQTFTQTVMNSCNPAFIEWGRRVGTERFFEYMGKLGLLEKTGIDIAGEASTIIHKQENVGEVELATMSFGQSFQITPLQMLRAASAIINGGNLVTPHFAVKSVSEADGTAVEFNYEIQSNAIEEKTSLMMKDILRQVVEDGGGKKAYLEGFSIGGKTATSQKLPRGSGKYISSFIGFSPVDNAKVIAMCLIDEPQGIYYGGTIAAPVIRELFENILPYLEIQNN
ncbi:peptidoglycan D,D-transpeptidase FtsI family protein [Lachnospira hominis (ex Liu et al. 2021)]|uniref:Peptidoglycan glycosyltransferase n=1 Tax=Lachnospira hominis (ex Liu et al. 2021) TaxID=2763051 RepID=A0ABR7G2I1_9FIRM|nr:penicillin-binding transpeptidase domain-containing protein [Lachnospira hominis]MBC5681130.1 peptidoglycan glycosyltransferase [Lachnospira hominis]